MNNIVILHKHVNRNEDTYSFFKSFNRICESDAQIIQDELGLTFEEDMRPLYGIYRSEIPDLKSIIVFEAGSKAKGSKYMPPLGYSMSKLKEQFGDNAIFILHKKEVKKDCDINKNKVILFEHVEGDIKTAFGVKIENIQEVKDVLAELFAERIREIDWL